VVVFDRTLEIELSVQPENFEIVTKDFFFHSEYQLTLKVTAPYELNL